MILMHDGLDTQWDENSEEYWDQINPQPDNSDEGYDEDNSDPTVAIIPQEEAILQRVRKGPVTLSTEEVEELRNEVVAEVDSEYEKFKQALITHFFYDKGEVFWPRGFSKSQEEEQRKIGKCYRMNN